MELLIAGAAAVVGVLWFREKPVSLNLKFNQDEQTVGPNSAYILTNASFKSFMEQQKSIGGKLVVLYHAKWCPHCVNFMPIFDQIAAESGNSLLRFAKIDCAKYGDVCSDIYSYPTIKTYSSGSWPEGLVYTGSRDKQTLSNFLRS